MLVVVAVVWLLWSIIVCFSYENQVANTFIYARQHSPCYVTIQLCHHGTWGSHSTHRALKSIKLSVKRQADSQIFFELGTCSKRKKKERKTIFFFKILLWMVWQCDLNIQEVEAGESPTQRHLQLHWKVWLKQKERARMRGKGKVSNIIPW